MCGEARKPELEPQASNRSVRPPQGTTTQQPSAHPVAQWRDSQTAIPSTTLPSPPAATFQSAQGSPKATEWSQGQQPWVGPTVAYNESAKSSPAQEQPGLARLPSAYAASSDAAFNSLNSPMRVSYVSAKYVPTANTLPDDGRMSVSFDFGTTFSGIAYGSSRIAHGAVQQILNWPGSFETFRKIPTCLLYDATGQVVAWGLEAKSATPGPGMVKCEWFKLYLEPSVLRDQRAVDPRLPPLPPGKRTVDLIIDYLTCMWEYAKGQITKEIGAVADLDSADVWVTVPAAWDAKGCSLMREAAIAAGLVYSARPGDTAWRDRLHIIPEPEAAAVHCAYLTNLHHLQPTQNFMICDAGGGTVDLAVYRILGELSNLEIAELCARSGANCGSLFLDLRFREMIKALLSEHPIHLEQASLASFIQVFSEVDKLAYRGEEDDQNMFRFNCFNSMDDHDPHVGLVNGELCIPGIMLRQEVFNPVINEVLTLIEQQMKRVRSQVDALLLVGGFSGSEYLYRKVEAQFGSRIKTIARPSDADTATARGAARYGLSRRPLVSSVIAPRSYMMKVKLPAEQEDWMKRPAYIVQNNSGLPVCENRVQYLVQKGAILRRGQMVRTNFCKFSEHPQDSVFVATLFTSDSDQIMRYTDEGATSELCKWTVDLTSLPSFQQQARLPQPNGFYTEFELGLEMDTSTEVRGVLISEGKEWGRVMFDFLT